MKAADETVYRLDSFTVPSKVRDDFLGRVRETHALLKTQPGFIQDFLLEQPAAGDTFRLVTLVAWENSAAIEGAKTAVRAHHARASFSPQAFFERAGIRADLGSYRSAR